MENNTAIAKPACFSKNLYQEKSQKCRPNSNLKKGKLFSIYSSTQPVQKRSKQLSVKPFRQWNKNIRPENDNFLLKNETIISSLDKYSNITLISNGAGQHAITILSSTKIAMAVSKSSPTNLPIQSPKLAALHIRCIDDTTSVMFEFPTTKLADNKASTEILYSIDNGPDYLLGLTLSQGDNILGLWVGKRAVPFTSKILGKSSLHINVWDKESTEHTFTFDVSNLGEAIHNLRSACNW